MKSFKLFFLIIFSLLFSKMSLGASGFKQSHPRVGDVFDAIFNGDIEGLKKIQSEDPFQYNWILDGGYEFSPFETALYDKRFDLARFLLRLASEEEKAEELFKSNFARFARMRFQEIVQNFLARQEAKESSRLAALRIQEFARKLLLARKNKHKNSSELEEVFQDSSHDGEP